MEAKAWQLYAAAGTHLENRIYVKRNERVQEAAGNSSEENTGNAQTKDRRQSRRYRKVT